MDIVFFGTGEYGIKSLEKLYKSEHNIVLVITQPDSKKGRGHKFKPSPIKEKALELELEIFQPENINSSESIEEIENKNADLFVVISYGSILKSDILKIPKKGSINSHPSLLPKYRGAAPIQRTLMNGETKTGVSIIDVVEKLDAGDILAKERIEIENDWNYGVLREKLSEISSNILLSVVDDIKDGKEVRKEQGDIYTYAHKIKNEEKYLDLNMNSFDLRNIIRGLVPSLTPLILYNGQLLGITEVEEEDSLDKGEIGEVVEINKKKGILVRCNNSGIWLRKVKPEGKKEMSFKDYINGTPIKVGDKLFSKGEL